MRRIVTLGALSCCAALISPAPASAQRATGWAVEVAVGATRPPPSIVGSDSDGGTGFGVDLRGELPLSTSTAAYLSLSRYSLRFSTSNSLAGRGLGAGLRFGAVDGRGPWIAGGALLGQRQYGGLTPTRPLRMSSIGFGGEGSIGWAIPVSPGMSMLPTVTYRRFSANGESGPVSTSFYLFAIAVRFNSPR